LFHNKICKEHHGNGSREWRLNKFSTFIFGKKPDLLDYVSSVYSRGIVKILMLKVWLSLNELNEKE